ncbi:transcription termination factor Rho [Ruminococcus sp. AM28-41]|nr:transcription termination factor Rho [Ruminococcus sp. AM28-41]RHU90038.1 transcription termination factor Rho [Ruminococcus sp. OM08-7]
MREKYESLSLATLKELAKARGLKGVSALRKPELIERMLHEDELENASKSQETMQEKPQQENISDSAGVNEEPQQYARPQQYIRPQPYIRQQDRQPERMQDRNQERQDRQPERAQDRNQERMQERPQYHAPSETAQLDSGERADGILEVLPDGYGFIRCENYMPGENDIYVSPSQIRRFNLKTGDIIKGNIRIKTQGEKFSALLYVTSINGFHPSEGQKRYNFEDMTPIFPNERLKMERPGGTVAMRIVDLISPIGKGQRGMIVSPPKAGKTTLLKDVAKSILRNNPDMHLIILLIDERPEEVTDIKEAIRGDNVEVIYSTFDELPEHHKRVSEMVVERARRLVEHKKDVTILLDSITRLARAYNLIIPPSGRTLSGGLDPAALHMPKRFFGAARNMREGGSLTILATALVDTGSKMDDVIYEEFKGTGNMELVLDRKLQEKRVFPAIDIQKSGTRREDLLLSREEQEAVYIMRKALNGMKSEDAVEQILNMFARTKNNEEFVQTVKKQKFI